MALSLNLPHQIGHYRIIQCLGEGGMGTVYLAEDLMLATRKVALKVPNLDSKRGPRILERFLREAKVAANITHPNFCTIYDYGEDNGRPYIVMPVIEGKTLSKLLASSQPWPPAQAVRLVHTLATALADLHNQHIYHRDLKPSNIMIRSDGLPVIMDYGLAYLAQSRDPRLSYSGELIGTPRYMSPEQVEGKRDSVGPAMDVYSLGAIFYEMLTGTPPFEAEDLLPLFHQILNVSPNPPSVRCPELDPTLDAICLRALSKLSKDRYSSMQDFAHALEQFDPTLAPASGTAPTAVLVPPATLEGTYSTKPVEVSPSLLPDVLVGSKSTEIRNSVGMRFVVIPPGTFLMGSPKGMGNANEQPQHEVEIAKPFYMAVFQVTQEDYQRVVGKNAKDFGAAGRRKVGSAKSSRFPVEYVSWDEAVSYCDLLSNLPEEKEAGRVYHLPTEAQWEYACRGGTASSYHFGNALSPKQANFSETGLGHPCPVGSFSANSFGLFDMHGNVLEWCLDRFDENFYRESPKKDPQCTHGQQRRVLRGGSWYNKAANCRSAYRSWNSPDVRYIGLGFRVCFTLLD